MMKRITSTAKVKRQTIGLVTLAFCAAIPATPADTATQVYQFTAECSDCSGVLGTLTLQDYQPGDALTIDNLVSFEYASSVFSADTSLGKQNVVTFTGILPAFGPADFAFSYYFSVPGGGIDGWSLNSEASGAWQAYQGSSVLDFGPSHEFQLLGISAVPEPASWALMTIGFGLAGATIRRHRPAVKAAFAPAAA
jgi:hypothetical protein